MRLLVVEDERRTAEYLRKGLSENGYVVDTANEGEEGLQLALKGTYDLLILDINLPGRDGWSILRETRAKGIETPVIFLSARDQVVDRVKGLGLGADDYLVKPFAFSELLARLQTISRRGKGLPMGALQLADLEMDLVQRTVRRGKKRLELTQRDFALLSLLLRRKGEVLSRTVILEQVWDMNFNTETNVVDVAIGRLREKVDKLSKVKLIHTIRGEGYVLRVKEVDE